MILNREGRIEYTPVLKELLLSLLHLNDERLSLLVLAIDIEDGTAIAIAITKALTIKIGKIPNYLLAIEERIEETNEQILVERCAEQLLESEVGIGIDVLGTIHLLYLLHASFCHISLFRGFCCKNRNSL